MAIWYFECMDASACQSGSNTYLVGPHKGCENKPAGCMPAFYVFFIINFAQIVLAILKRWGVTCSSWSMLCAGQASNANVAMHAAATRRGSLAGGTEPADVKAGRWSAVKKVLKRKSRPAEMFKMIKQATIILLVSVLVGLGCLVLKFL